MFIGGVHGVVENAKSDFLKLSYVHGRQQHQGAATLDGWKKKIHQVGKPRRLEAAPKRSLMRSQSRWRRYHPQGFQRWHCQFSNVHLPANSLFQCLRSRLLQILLVHQPIFRITTLQRTPLTIGFYMNQLSSCNSATPY